MKNIFLSFFIIFSIIGCKKDKNINIQEIDDNKYIGLNYNFLNGDNGIIIDKIEISELDGYDAFGNKSIVEKIFSNNNKEIYFIGAEYRGNGIFWIYNNDIKEIILETNIRYGSVIYWHGENAAEIIIPTGSPFSHSYFYNFNENKISNSYEFPLYYDIDSNILLVWGNYDFELYDILNNELIKIYNARRENELNAAWPYVGYYIEKINTEIMFYYNDTYENKKGLIILDIKAKLHFAYILSQISIIS
jgi:hypothetical protein